MPNREKKRMLQYFIFVRLGERIEKDRWKKNLIEAKRYTRGVKEVYRDSEVKSWHKLWPKSDSFSLSIIGCVALGKTCNLSESQFLHLKYNTNLEEFFVRVKYKANHTKQNTNKVIIKTVDFCGEISFAWSFKLLLLKIFHTPS